MSTHFIAAILGVVEGLTEFLPVSSTGHLIVVGHLVGFTGAEADAFDVFIQLGAILAVVIFFRTRFWNLIGMKASQGFAGRRGVLLLVLTTLPALIIGGIGHHWIKAHLFEPFTVAIGLTAGAVWILLTEWFYRHRAPRDLNGLSWRGALGIGLFQCAAMWPGMSRSASTILGGMLLGLDRKAATEYSFFAAVPVMLAACVFDIYKSWPILKPEAVPYFTTGFAIAFLSAWLAVRFLIGFVSRHSLKAFAWYRLILAALIFALMR